MQEAALESIGEAVQAPAHADSEVIREWTVSFIERQAEDRQTVRAPRSRPSAHCERNVCGPQLEAQTEHLAQRLAKLETCVSNDRYRALMHEVCTPAAQGRRRTADMACAQVTHVSSTVDGAGGIGDGRMRACHEDDDGGRSDDGGIHAARHSRPANGVLVERNSDGTAARDRGLHAAYRRTRGELREARRMVRAALKDCAALRFSNETMMQEMAEAKANYAARLRDLRTHLKLERQQAAAEAQQVRATALHVGPVPGSAAGIDAVRCAVGGAAGSDGGHCPSAG